MINFANIQLHEVAKLRAKAVLSSAESTRGWLDVIASDKDGKELEVTFFMPYEAALAYASAINTVNDREAVEESDLGHYEETERKFLVPEIDG